MSTTRREVNSFYHGPVDIGTGNSADYVIAHAKRQRQRGKGPSVAYNGETNPRVALEDAKYDLLTRMVFGTGTEGYGRIGIKVQDTPPAEYGSKLQWLNPNGLVGIKHVVSDVPHEPLRGGDYIPNPDGTVAITKPDQAEIERLQALEAHERLGEVYLGYLDAHQEADWVMVGDRTGEVYGGGTDEQTFGEEAYEVLERAVGEKVHFFGRPVDGGLDGATPVFPE